MQNADTLTTPTQLTDEEEAARAQPEQQPQQRVNPRRQTRSLVADIETDSGLRFHGISQDVSPVGASFIITGNREALAHLRVGERVRVKTTTAQAMRAEINSIRMLPGDEARPLVGLKLLDGQRWLSGPTLDTAILVGESS